ncbi:FAD-dependent oxidoreductase [Gorillibacterium timonense]|uniref:FAD-dependent oxidoreductase n=1 Tax=Gorillibacterium timonense TaxID=1689269 RepID=UPI00071E3211|nr:FAD-dependent oxidoreductase [Gorillibacterium timonense]
MHKLDRHMRIGIIGAGMSGASAAHYLKQKGYTRITLLEKDDSAGGKCHSIHYRGRTYEMGALIGLPTSRHTIELMKEYGLEEKGPLLERGFFDNEGRKISQIPVGLVQEFAKEFKRLPQLLGRYQKLQEPGFLGLPPELCRPFAEWCDENGLPVTMEVFRHYFSTFGFGSVENTPAAYVLKFLSYENLLSFIEITHMITWPSGVRELIRRMADRIEDLRLTCEVRRMEPQSSGEIRVETDHEAFTFDKVIYTGPMHQLGRLLDLPPEDVELLSLIRHERFRVYAYSVRDLPPHSGYLPENLQPGRNGDMMAWYYRWKSREANDLVTIYVMENEKLSDAEIRENIEATLKRLGGTSIRLFMMKSWLHFPHVGAEALRSGFYERLDRLQGQRGIYYAGELFNFPTLERCAAYSKHLVERFFSE